MNVLDVTWPDKYFYKFTALLTIIPYIYSWNHNPRGDVAVEWKFDAPDHVCINPN